MRRINVGGNTKTRDEVVRREMRQMEGGWYDAAAINRSRTRIDRLGFFDEVTVETPRGAGHDRPGRRRTSRSRRRPTGNLMLGAGFSSSENIVLSASISQQNLFGSGNALTLGLNTSQSSRTLALSFTNPYYTVDGVSLGWDLYHRTYDADELDSVSPYKTVSTGGRHPPRLADRRRRPRSTSASPPIAPRSPPTTLSPQAVQGLLSENGLNNVSGVGECTVDSLLLTVGWSRDGRDSFTYPRSGVYQRVYGEVSVPVGDLRYGKLGYQYQHWFPIGYATTR